MTRAPDSAVLSHAPTPSGRASQLVAAHANVNTSVGTSANDSRIRKRRPRKPIRFTCAPGALPGRRATKHTIEYENPYVVSHIQHEAPPGDHRYHRRRGKLPQGSERGR